MTDFNPDAYLASKKSNATSTFDPNRYLSSKGVTVNQEEVVPKKEGIISKGMNILESEPPIIGTIPGTIKRGGVAGISSDVENISKKFPSIADKPYLQVPLAAAGTIGQMAYEAIPSKNIDFGLILLGGPLIKKGSEVVGTVETGVKSAGKKIGDILKEIPTTVSQSKKIQLWNDTKRSMFDSFGSKIDEYGDALKQATANNPTAKVNVDDIFSNIKLEEGAGILDPKVKYAINNIPQLKALSEAPSGTKLDASAVQDLINSISSKFPETKLGGKTAYRPADMGLKNLMNEFKAAQVEAYPEMIPVKKDYGEFKQAYNGIKNKFLSENFFENLDKNFSNPIVKSYIDKVLPSEAISDLGGYRMAAKAVKWTKKGAIGIGGALALGAAGKKGFEVMR